MQEALNVADSLSGSIIIIVYVALLSLAVSSPFHCAQPTVLEEYDYN